MEMQNDPNRPSNMDELIQEHQQRNQRGKIAAGILLFGMGGLLLARQMGALIPSWVMSWQMLLIVIGLLIGARHGFRRGGWFVPILIGGVFLVADFVPSAPIKHYFWPVFFMLAGLFFIFKKQRKHDRKEHFRKKFFRGGYTPPSADEQLDIVSIFSGAKKNIITKDFRGGEVTCVFGGAEINMSQSDFTGVITLEGTAVFGGAKFLIPAHWSVQSEVTCIFGSVEDNRPMTNVMPDTEKILVLKGTCLFGGIEISSY
ncbi:MAG: hypothetical protein V4616_04640 [Bacteroidota bacterium]